MKRTLAVALILTSAPAASLAAQRAADGLEPWAYSCRLSPTPPPRGTMDGAAPSDGVQIQRGAVAVPDSVRKKVGYQHWKGGAIGATVGGLAGLLLSQLSGQCSDCTSSDSDVLEITAIGAGLGGAFGFLVGAASPKYEWVPP